MAKVDGGHVPFKTFSEGGHRKKSQEEETFERKTKKKERENQEK